MSDKPTGEDHLAAAVLHLNEAVAGKTGRDIGAEVLTPAQVKEVKAAAARALRR